MVTQDTTLDGVVEAAGGWFPPQDDGADTSDRLDVVREHMTGRSVFLVGRRTSEDVRGFWPHRTADTTGISAHLDALEKAVVSRTLTGPGWAGTTVLAGDPSRRSGGWSTSTGCSSPRGCSAAAAGCSPRAPTSGCRHRQPHRPLRRHPAHPPGGVSLSGRRRCAGRRS